MYTVLPAIIDQGIVVDPGSEEGNVTFPFLYMVEADLPVTVSWSPGNGTCGIILIEMDKTIIVTCSGLENDVEYTVTVEGILLVDEKQLPFTFSRMFTPMDLPALPPSSSGLWG